MTPRSISIVIPALNEALRLPATLAAIRDFRSTTDLKIELIVVDDGSRDNTAELVADEPGARLVRNDVTRGKGNSLRRGVESAADADAMLLMDADLCTPLNEIDRFLSELAAGADIVIASRDLPSSRLDPPQPLMRRWLAYAFRAFRRSLLLPEIRDTQCGFKLYRGAVAKQIFRRTRVDGWLIDCEALALAVRLGYRVREIGVLWRDHRQSRVRPVRDAPRVVWDLLRIATRRDV